MSDTGAVLLADKAQSSVDGVCPALTDAEREDWGRVEATLTGNDPAAATAAAKKLINGLSHVLLTGTPGQSMYDDVMEAIGTVILRNMNLNKDAQSSSEFRAILSSPVIWSQVMGTYCAAPLPRDVLDCVSRPCTAAR